MILKPPYFTGESSESLMPEQVIRFMFADKLKE